MTLPATPTTIGEGSGWPGPLAVVERYDIVSEQAGQKLMGTQAGTIGPLLPGLAGDATLQLVVFPREEAHRIPVGLPDFKSGVGL